MPDQGSQYPTLIPARPTIYNGTRMRSRLEAHFARWLDSWRSITWRYEPCAFGSQAGQYLPDFVVDGFRCTWLDGPQRVYFEVKPSVFGWQHEWDWDVGELTEAQQSAVLREDELHARMATVWASDPDALLVVAKQRAHGGADFRMLSADPDDPGSAPWTEPVDLVLADFDGFVPSFTPVAAGAPLPPWPTGFWRAGL